MRFNAAAEPAAPAAGHGVDLDLDLDFSLDDEPPAAISDITGGSANPVPYEQTVKLDQAEAAQVPSDSNNALSMDFDLPDASAPAPSFEPVAQSLPEISLDLDLPSKGSDDNSLNFDSTSPIPVAAPSVPEPSNTDGMLEFDIGSLSMELDTPATPATAEQPTDAPSIENEDPLETKLALAAEFVSIGDEDGARALIEEVLAEATGATREKAQRALSQLS